MLALFRALAAALLATTVIGDCAFTQKCYTHTDGCYPIPAVGDDTVPKPFSNEGTENPLPFVCPQYSDLACCNGKQNLAIAENQALIQAAFNDLGGNMACVDNIVAMWCAFTCSPNQAEFVTTQGFANMTAPFPGGIYEVLVTSINVDAYFACGIFESCKNTYTTELVGFATCEQFLDYQVAQGISAGSFSTFNYTFNPNHTVTHSVPVVVGDSDVKYVGVPTVEDAGLVYMSPPVYDCCNYPFNLSNLTQGNISAPCIYCSGMCGTPGDVCYTTPDVAGANFTQAIIDAVSLSALYGLDWVAVTATYSTALAVTIGFLVWKRFLSCRKGQENACGCRNGCESWDIGEDETSATSVVPSTPSRKSSTQSRTAQYSMPHWHEDTRVVLNTSASTSGPTPNRAQLASPDKQYYAMQG